MSKSVFFVVAFMAVVHFAIMLAEIFAWDAMGGRLLNTQDQGLLDVTRSMAINQGIYNGFLAVGLIWSLFIADNLWKQRIAMFFLGCIAVAGVVGFATVSTTILVVQTVPSVIGLILIAKNRPQV